MPTKVTATQANKVLEAVKTKFRVYIDAGYSEPKLMQDWDGYAWVIMWEEGPFEWTYDPIEDRALDQEMSSMVGRAVYLDGVALPKGIWCEPINHYSLAIYRDF